MGAPFGVNLQAAELVWANSPWNKQRSDLFQGGLVCVFGKGCLERVAGEVNGCCGETLHVVGAKEIPQLLPVLGAEHLPPQLLDLADDGIGPYIRARSQQGTQR
jgi:hypothetical protein